MSKQLQPSKVASHLQGFQILSKSEHRIYTAHNNQIPDQLSYQSIKLANFIELQLSDIQDSISCISKQNFNNQVKQILSRSYSTVHEMQILFKELNMKFLYSQIKKLVRSYGQMFLQMIDRLQGKQTQLVCEKLKNQTNQHVLMSRKQSRKNIKSSFRKKQQFQQNQVCKNIVIIEKEAKKKSPLNYLGGIHLFNENYERYMDFDIEQFKQMREQKQKLIDKKQMDRQQRMKQEDLRFRKQMMAELTDNSHLITDQQQRNINFNSQKIQINKKIRNISLTDQLQDIAKFFRQSQNQALNFLKQSKSRQQFHHLTEGFNEAVQFYLKSKNENIKLLQDKISQLMEFMNLKVGGLQTEIIKKQKQIQQILDMGQLKCPMRHNVQTQTYESYDQQIRILTRKLIDYELLNQQQKIYFMKRLDEQKKQSDLLINRLNTKQDLIKKMRQNIQQQTLIRNEMQKRIKALVQITNNTQINPLRLLQSMSRIQKKNLIMMAKSQGIFHGLLPENQQRVKIRQKSSKKKHINTGLNLETAIISQQGSRNGSVFKQEEQEEQEKLKINGQNKRSQKQENNMQIQIIKEDKNLKVIEQDRQKKASIVKKQSDRVFKINRNQTKPQNQTKKIQVFDQTVPNFVPDKLQTYLNQHIQTVKAKNVLKQIFSTFKSHKKLQDNLSYSSRVNSQTKIPSFGFLIDNIDPAHLHKKQPTSIEKFNRQYQNVEFEDRAKLREILDLKSMNKTDIDRKAQIIQIGKSQHKNKSMSKNKNRPSICVFEDIKYKSCGNNEKNNQIQQKKSDHESFKANQKHKVQKSLISSQFQININGSSIKSHQVKNSIYTQSNQYYTQHINRQKSGFQNQSQPNFYDRIQKNLKSNNTVYKSSQINSNSNYQIKTKNDCKNKCIKKMKTEGKQNDKTYESVTSTKYFKQNKLAVNQNKQTIERLYSELGSQAMVKLAKLQLNNDKFRQQAQKIHLKQNKKCGANCKHLQRFLNIYGSLHKQLLKLTEKSNRKILQCPVQNFTKNFESKNRINESEVHKKAAKLPSLNKK